MPPRFSAESLRFLRAMKRNNDREWFRARRDVYDRVVRAPMIAVIEQLALDFRRFAPEIVASPKTSLYRVYRDAPGDPASEYLKYTHFLAGREFPPALAATAAFYPAVLETFRAAMPLVRFLNEPLTETSEASSYRS